MVWKLTCLEPSMNCFFSCQPSLNRRFFLNHAVFGQDLDLDELGGLITWSPAPWVAWASDVCQVGRSWDRDEFSLNSHFLFQIPRYPRYPRSIPDFFLVHFGEATQLWWSLSHVISLLFFLSWDGAVDPWQVYTQEYLVYLAEDASGTARSQVESAVPVGGLAQQRPARFSSQNGGSTVSLMGNFMGG